MAKIILTILVATTITGCNYFNQLSVKIHTNQIEVAVTHKW